MKPGRKDLGNTLYKWYKESKDQSREWREEAKDMYDMRDGHQWTPSEESELAEKQRMPVVFNRISPYIDYVIGQQVNNRQEVRYLPRENSDNPMADIYSEAVRWADDLCDAEDEITDAFEDMVTCGMGWTQTRMDYSEDPKGLLKTAERIDPIEMFWDPGAKKRNLSDAQRVQRARRFDPATAKAKWPKLENIVPDMDIHDDEGPAEPHDQQQAYKYENDQSGETYPRDSFYVIVQTQWWCEEVIWVIEDPQTQQLHEMDSEEFNSKKKFFDLYGIQYERTTQKRYYQAFSTREHILSEGLCASQNGFTLKAMCAKRDRNKRSWYGLVRAMSDPQKFSNKFFSDMMHIIATNRKGGLYAEEGAFLDPKQAREDQARPDAMIMLKQGALAKGMIQEREAGNLPAGMDRLMQIAIQAFPSTTGMPQELLGSAERDQAGIVEASRKESGLTILAPMFGSLKRHTRERGRVVLEMLEEYMSDGRLIRITQKNGQPAHVPLQKTEEMTTYDIIVDEVATSPNQKAQVLSVFREIAPFLQSAGIAPPPSLLDYLPLPSTLTEEWKEAMQPKQEGPPPNPLAEAEKVKQEGVMAKAQMDAQVKMQGIEAQKQRDNEKVLMDQRKLMLDEREQAINAMLRSAELRLKEADLEATHGENLVDLDLKRVENQAKVTTQQ